MKKNGALDIIFKIISILLCIVLVPALIVTVMVGSISSIVTPKTLTKVIKTVDIQDVISENQELSASLTEAGVTEETIEQMLESETVEQLVEVYVEDINAVILNGDTTNFNSETIKNIINENKDEVKEIVKDLAGDKVSQEELDKEIDKFIDENFVQIVESLPKPQEIIEDIPEDALEVIRVFNSGIVTNICIGFCAVLILLILLLRFREFSFFIWFSVISIITAVFLTSIYSGLRMTPAMLPGDMPVSQDTIGSIMGVLTQNILITLIIMFVLAAVFMASFFAIRNFRNKKKGEKVIEEVQPEEAPV